MFSGTIAENMRNVQPDATDDEIIDALKASCAWDFVKKLPDGINSKVGERGTGFSEGQAQRLSIARVFLKNPAILILDEATSSLDNTTEILIQQALDELCKGRTTLVVAHRLSTIRDADLILVMRDGDIVEQGTHDQLIEAGGFYADLYNSQFEDVVD